MISTRGLVQTMKGWLGKPIATPESDPSRYFGTMFALPNPDPILREMGRAEQVYYGIMADPHVMGELRSIRGSFRSHQYRLEEGKEGDSKAAAAKDMCEAWMKSQAPNQISDWLEVMWQMSASILTGYRVHEVVWDLVGGNYLPSQVIDRPGRRFKFDMNANPLLVSRDHWQGQPVEPYQFIVSRHMPTMDNPYGMALLSSCFWPWTFKTGGWRYFVKYCERHGLPWPVGRYPAGTSEAEQDQLADALANMVEAGYVVVQEGTGLELLTPSSSGSNLPQQNLITLCNREMSKALTSQAMIGEQLDVGARAASETAKDRQGEVHDSDRDIAAASMAQIFKWITLFNFGDGVSPPTLEFFKQENAGKDRAETYQIAANMGAKPSKSAMLDELGIPEAEDEADALLPVLKVPPNAANPNPPEKSGTGNPAAPQIDFSALAGFTFAKAAGMTEDEAMQLAADAADQAIEDKMIAPVYQMLVQFEAEGKTLAEFQTAFEAQVGQMDDEALREVIDRAMTYSMLRGAATSVD
jgi:phage gp29-like protein